MVLLAQRRQVTIACAIAVSLPSSEQAEASAEEDAHAAALFQRGQNGGSCNGWTDGTTTYFGAVGDMNQIGALSYNAGKGSCNAT